MTVKELDRDYELIELDQESYSKIMNLWDDMDRMDLAVPVVAHCMHDIRWKENLNNDVKMELYRCRFYKRKGVKFTTGISSQGFPEFP